MAQKLLKHELVERLLKLKEKQDELTMQMQCLSQEINALAQPYMPKEPKPQPLITMRLVAQVLCENPDWMFCGEIAEKCSGTLIPQSSIGGKIPSTRGFYNEKSKTFFQPGVQS